MRDAIVGPPTPTCDAALVQALGDFLTHPNEPSFLDLARHLSGFIIGQARSWRRTDMDFGDRCRELLAEVFLVLTQSFDGHRQLHPGALFNYLEKHLRKLTRLRDKTKTVPFGLADDLPDVGRADLLAENAELIDTVVRVVRRATAHALPTRMRRLEALFIHLEPNLRAASLALDVIDGKVKKSVDPEALGPSYEADKKRHQQFNQRLREQLDRWTDGQFVTILDWPRGLRSHLGWQLISFSAGEQDALGSVTSEAFERALASDTPLLTWLVTKTIPGAWPEHLTRLESTLLRLYPESETAVALQSLAPTARVAEPAAPFGPAMVGDDTLERLLGLVPTPDARTVRTPPPPPIADPTTPDGELQAYMQVVDALLPFWRETLRTRLREPATNAPTRPD